MPVVRIARRRHRRGVTLVEILIALIILSGALMGMANFLSQYTHSTKSASAQMRAFDLITNRMDTVRQAPTYAGIDSMAVTQTITMDSTTYTRQTMVLHVGGQPSDSLDYKIITIQVSQSSLTSPVRKTTYIGSY